MEVAEARERLAGARVARLATVGGDRRPHLVPICFAVAADSIFSAVDAKPKSTLRLRRLANIAAHPLVTVLADHYEENWDALWWVRADGRARVHDPGSAAADRAVELLGERYRQYRRQPPTGPVIEVVVERWTGWRAS